MARFKPFWLAAMVLMLGAGCAGMPTYEVFDCDDPDNFPPTATGKLKVTKSLDRVPGRYIVELSEDRANEITELMFGEKVRKGTEVQKLLFRGHALKARGEILGGEEVFPLVVINGFTAKFDKAGIASLRSSASSAGIVEISQSTRVSIPPADVLQAGSQGVDPLRLSGDHSWSQDRHNQRSTELDENFDQRGYGKGTHFGVIDTGIDADNVEFAGRMGMCETAIVNPPDAFGCLDDHGHGTHVAAIGGGDWWGVAKEATIHSCRALQDGHGEDWQVILCIDKHILNKRQLEADNPGENVLYIVNESIGGDYNAVSDRANCRMIHAGMMNVVAAGNTDWSLCHGSPARVLQAVTVGATGYSKDGGDPRAYFSSHDGDAPLCKGGLDIHAAGWNVISAKIGGCTPQNCPWMSGTSMAAPAVAGAAAMIWGLNPEWDQEQVIEELNATATPSVTDSRSVSNLLVNVGPQD